MKVSNINGLRELALEKLHQHLPKWEKSGFDDASFSLKFSAPDLFWVLAGHRATDDVPVIDYKLTVKLESRQKGDAGYCRKTGRNTFVIFRHGWCMENYKPGYAVDKLASTFVHEVTHVSQFFNDFINHAKWVHSREYHKAVSKKHQRKLNYHRWYSRRAHDTRLDEHECRLVQVLQYLLEGKQAKAVDFLLSHRSYFYFDFRSFVGKAYSYGVSGQQINDFRAAVMAKLDEEFTSTYSNYYSHYCGNISELVPVFNMLRLGHRYTGRLVDWTHEVHARRDAFSVVLDLDKQLENVREVLDSIEPVAYLPALPSLVAQVQEP